MQTLRFIKVSSSGASTTITLADGTKKMIVFPFEIEPQANVQVVPRPRAANVDVYYRDNLMHLLRFTVRRELASYASVHSFMGRHAQDVSGRGSLQSSEGGHFSSVLTAVNCALQVRGFDPQGIAVYVHYEVIAPRIITIGGLF